MLEVFEDHGDLRRIRRKAGMPIAICTWVWSFTRDFLRVN
jgi:hypothetical protein